MMSLYLQLLGLNPSMQPRGMCSWHSRGKKSSTTKPPKFTVGTKVLKKDFKRRSRKGGGLDPRWLGPFVITKDMGKGFFSLRCVQSGTLIPRIHGAHLKSYLTPPSSPEITPAVSNSGYDSQVSHTTISYN